MCFLNKPKCLFAMLRKLEEKLDKRIYAYVDNVMIMYNTRKILESMNVQKRTNNNIKKIGN